MKTNKIEFYCDKNKKILEVDSNYQVVKLTTYYSKSKKIEAIYEYDKHGKLIKKISYFSDGDIHYIRKYNEDEKLIKEIYYNGEDETVEIIKEFDENEQLIKRVEFFKPNDYFYDEDDDDDDE
jgi:antitoxin component YwqK of YwqJK toxin-antitoxin module